MIATDSDLEMLLERLGRRYQSTGDGVFLVSMGMRQPPCALRLAPPVLVAQAYVGKAPQGSSGAACALFRRLLELNATGLLHAAFALEGDAIVLTAALPLENLDLNELEAVLADVDLALGEHVPTLREVAGLN